MDLIFRFYSFAKILTLKGEIKSGYVGSGPPKDTSLHRYVFLVYKQHGKQDFSSVHHLSSHTAKNREKFSAR